MITTHHHHRPKVADLEAALETDPECVGQIYCHDNTWKSTLGLVPALADAALAYQDHGLPGLLRYITNTLGRRVGVVTVAGIPKVTYLEKGGD